MPETPDKPDIWKTAPKIPTPQEVTEVWRRICVSAVDAMFAGTGRMTGDKSSLPFDPAAPARALGELGMAVLADPAALTRTQRQFVEDWTALMKGRLGAGADAEALAVKPARGDRRFSDPAWDSDPYFRMLRDSYLLAARSMLDLVAGTNGLDDKTRSRIDFFVRQYLYALAPTNFALTNPEVLRKTMETGGLNLLGGLANFLSDYAHPDAWVQRRASDGFTLGKDLAATPGAVIFQNDLMQVIQYDPATKDVYKRPLLYVPPLVNKYYMMDLKPSSSLFKWLVDQGFTVFTISWVNPDQSLQDKGLEDYVLEGPVAAIDAVLEATGEETLDLFSFCMGGALAAMALSWLQAKKQAKKVTSATMIGAMIDYDDLGEWSTFTEREQLEAFNTHLEETGMIAGNDLRKLFSVVRANDLIWNSAVDHYLMDRKAPPSDLLHWFADDANMTGAVLNSWSNDVLHANKLREPGGLALDGVPVDLSKVKTPIFNIALKDDHVSHWRAVYVNGNYFGGPVRFVLGGSGHNAGVINPPARNKHGYWLNDQPANDADSWLAQATQKEGSWWPEWQSWLTKGERKQERVAARQPGSGPLPKLEPAPGSYVLG